MPAFEYQALDTSGRTVKGVVEGDAERQVRTLLRDQGLMPLQVDAVAATGAARFGLAPRRMSGTDLALLTRQFATLAHAGLTIEECLNALIEQTESAGTRRILAAVRARVIEGQSLAKGLAAFPQAFPDIYCALIDAGEQSGHLGEVLERLAEYTENRMVLRQKVALAFIYPALVTIVAVLVVGLLLIYVVPQVTRVFANTGQALPLVTRALIGISDVVRAGSYFWIAGLVAVVVGARQAMRRPDLRRRWHAMLLRLPMVGRLVRGIDAARFANTLGILTSSGIPLLNALQYAVRVVTNLPMRDAVEAALRQVREGAGLARALGQTKLFPPMVVHLIASGEASGQLDTMLRRAADTQTRELESWVKALTALLEPVMILVMGVIVLFIVVAILLPIFEMNQMIK